MALKSIRSDRRRLADQVYDQLIDAIIGGSIGPDDRLVQERLATELDISRTPVREALLRLEQEGVLKTSPRGGFVLSGLTEADIRELYQARAAIESQTARLLAVENDALRHGILRATIQREEGIASPDLRARFDANRTIHRAFVEVLGNRYLLEMFDTVWNKAMAYQLFAASGTADLARAREDHMALVDAIETGDPVHAQDAFIDHIQAGFDRQITAMAPRDEAD